MKGSGLVDLQSSSGPCPAGLKPQGVNILTGAKIEKKLDLPPISSFLSISSELEHASA
jgi:hypothetical protein